MPAASPILFNCEFPANHSRVAGPVLWCRGWVLGPAGRACCEIRARCRDLVHRGILGFPRPDLAALFAPDRAWLPAGFVVGVPVSDGPAELTLEALDECGQWHFLCALHVEIAPDAPVESQHWGELMQAGNVCWTVRGAHQPFTGHLDDPAAVAPVSCGRAQVFGWLKHDRLPLDHPTATADLLVFNHLNHGPSVAGENQGPADDAGLDASRLRGWVDTPPTLDASPYIRIYAQLADGSTHLVLARPFTPQPPSPPAPPPRLSVVTRPATLRMLPPTPSGRPRRIVFALADLQPGESALRALDLARHLHATGAGFVRILATSGGALQEAFAATGAALQILPEFPLMRARDEAEVERHLAALARQIRLDGIELTVAFDTLSHWALYLAQLRGIPTALDKVDGSLLPGTGDAPASWRVSQARTWRQVRLLLLADADAAASCAIDFPHAATAIVPPWYDDQRHEPPAARAPDRLLWAVAPIRGTRDHGAHILLRAVDLLAREAPALAARWRVAVTDLRDTPEERAFTADVLATQPAKITLEHRSVADADLCLVPAFADYPHRAVLTAMAGGVPVATTAPPCGSAPPPRAAILDLAAGSAPAIAHALAAFACDPAPFRRRALLARSACEREHQPAPNQARWVQAVASLI